LRYDYAIKNVRSKKQYFFVKSAGQAKNMNVTAMIPTITLSGGGSGQDRTTAGIE
jgi:hypothetical protein